MYLVSMSRYLYTSRWTSIGTRRRRIGVSKGLLSGNGIACSPGGPALSSKGLAFWSFLATQSRSRTRPRVPLGSASVNTIIARPTPEALRASFASQRRHGSSASNCDVMRPGIIPIRPTPSAVSISPGRAPGERNMSNLNNQNRLIDESVIGRPL